MSMQTTGPSSEPGPDTKEADANAATQAEFVALNERRPTTFGEALAVPITLLCADRDAAAAEFEKVPCSMLTVGQRPPMSGKRYQEITEVSLLTAKGLDKHPEIVAATGVTPGALRTASDQDRASATLYASGDVLSSGGEDGSIMTAATVETVCGHVLAQEKTAHKAGTGDPQYPIDLEVSFREAYRLQAQHRATAPQTLAKRQGVSQAGNQHRVQALSDAQQARLITEFRASVKRK